MPTVASTDAERRVRDLDDTLYTLRILRERIGRLTSAGRSIDDTTLDGVTTAAHRLMEIMGSMPR